MVNCQNTEVVKCCKNENVKGAKNAAISILIIWIGSSIFLYMWDFKEKYVFLLVGMVITFIFLIVIVFTGYYIQVV
tara:strand:- start:303 stop:530 length:228 start_codon:yes stop_codon:yes gene_type:complete